MSAATGFQVVQARTGEAVSLAMQRLWLSGRVLAAGARLTVRHVFASEEKRPLEVIYSFALPRDAALRRFRVSGEGFSVRSELKPVAEAVKAYEAGIEAGHLSTLARQYGDGVVNLSLGNIRPGETVAVTLEVLAGVELEDGGLRFRFPFTLAPSYHSRARTVEVEPGVGEIELPDDEFGDVILPRYHADARGLHQVGFDLTLAMAQPVEEVGSPSHPVRVARDDAAHARIRLAGDHDVPDRDLVLDVRTKDSMAGVLAGKDREGNGRFVVVMPSESFGERPDSARRVVLVVDRSGSMGGVPMEQAKKAIEACLSALSEQDLFGVVAFDDKIEEFQSKLAHGTMSEREAARKFLARIDARGGTELARAIGAAAKILGKEGGDILVMTDGQVFGTEAVLEEARAAGVRIHCLGIGSASQDRFLALLARQTGGISRFLTPRERVDVPAVDLFASVGRPVAGALAVKGAAVLTELPACVFAGTPLVFFGEADGAAPPTLRVEWDAGHKELPLEIGASSVGETLRLLTGARLIADLESRVTSHAREEGRIEKRIEELSLAYGLASRRMALVAVVERAGDQFGDVPKTVVVPVGMPQDTNFGAYFGAPQQATMMASCAMPPMPAAPAAIAPSGSAAGGIFKALFSRKSAPALQPPTDRDTDDLLLDLISRIEPDGGMPGKNTRDRMLNTVMAVMWLVEEGHTLKRGAFRLHVERLTRYLEGLGTPELNEVLKAVRAGKALPGKWRTGQVAACPVLAELGLTA
jgi:Ca-activated chloride channel family protein